MKKDQVIEGRKYFVQTTGGKRYKYPIAGVMVVKACTPSGALVERETKEWDVPSGVHPAVCMFAEPGKLATSKKKKWKVVKTTLKVPYSHILREVPADGAPIISEPSLDDEACVL